LARHEAIAKQQFRDQLGAELRAMGRALYGGLDGRAASIVGRQTGEVALKTAHGRTGCAHNHNGVMRGVHWNAFC